MHLFWQLDAPALGNLQYRTNALDDVHAGHGKRHAALGEEAGREAAPTEIFMNRRAPFGGGQAIVCLLLADFPVWFHRWLAVGIALFTGTIQRRGAGVNQVDDTVLGEAGERFAGDAFNRFRRPVGTDVGEHLGGAG